MSYVSLKVLAKEVGMDRSHLRKYVLGLGIAVFKVRTPDSRNQLALAVSPEDAERIKTDRKRKGFVPGEVSAETGFGDFYAVILDPDARPNRVKFGFSHSLHNRMAAYRTTNPQAKLLHKWSSLPRWESTAIDALTVGCERIAVEIYECAELDEVVKRGNKFFRMFGIRDSTKETR